MFKEKELEEEVYRLRKFARKLSDNESDADDLLQSTLLKAIEKKRQFEQGTNLFRWCSKIMFNTFASNRRRECKFESKFDPEPIIESQVRPDDKYMHLRVAEVYDSMEKLTKPHRQVLSGICIEGIPYSDLAERLDVPVGTIRSRLFRAREELQKYV